MTRSVTIVNTSNWDGEDYEIITKAKGSDEEWLRHYLKPGESCKVVPGVMDIEFRPAGMREDARPFHLVVGTRSDRQVFPFVISGVGLVEKPVSG